MKPLRYYTCDAFTDRIFGGNPLAVIPDEDVVGAVPIASSATSASSAAR